MTARTCEWACSSAVLRQSCVGVVRGSRGLGGGASERASGSQSSTRYWMASATCRVATVSAAQIGDRARDLQDLGISAQRSPARPCCAAASGAASSRSCPGLRSAVGACARSRSCAPVRPERAPGHSLRFASLFRRAGHRRHHMQIETIDDGPRLGRAALRELEGAAADAFLSPA